MRFLLTPGGESAILFREWQGRFVWLKPDRAFFVGAPIAFALVAQWIERVRPKDCVGSSTLSGGILFLSTAYRIC